MSKSKQGSLNEPQFHKGMIVKMKLVNFMTYDKIKIHSRPKMNFILGPNGTGKSTFLCAIILGLGGEPSLIGRSKKVADYIKRGCQEAKIDIELYNPDGVNYLITRLISSNSTTRWELQGKSTNFNQISEIIASLNIQINNMCMILPQDRVQDFTKMNKKQLLLNTQKSVGDGDLGEMYDKLCDIRNNIKEQDSMLKEKSQRYEEQQQILKRIEVDVKSYHERRDASNKIENLKKKEAWLTYEEKMTLLEKLNEESKMISSEYEKAKNLLKPFMKAVKEGQQKEMALNSQIRSQSKALSQILTSINDLKRKHMAIKSNISSIKADLAVKIDAEKNRENEINVIVNQINRLEEGAPSKTEEVLLQEIKAAEKETEALLKQFSEIRLKENEIRGYNNTLNHNIIATEHKISQAESVNDTKISILQNYKDVYEAYKWLAENRELFSGRVYGPMFIELSVKNPENAKYVEKVIPFRDLVAFVCENSQDTTKLLSIVRDKQRLQINVLNSSEPNKSVKELYPPPEPLDNLRKFGFHSYLNDLIEGPPAILNYLCSQLGFHKIPVGSDKVLKHIDDIPITIKLFFSNTRVFQTRVSHYSGERLQVVRELDEAKFLEHSVNQELIKSLKRHKENQMREQVEYHQKESQVLEMKKKIEIELNQARNNKHGLQRNLEFLKTSNIRLKMKRDELAQLQQVNFDKEEEELKAKEKIFESAKELIALKKIHLEKLKEYFKTQTTINLRKLEVEFGVEIKLKDDERELKFQEEESLRLKGKIDRIKSDIVRAKAEIKFYYNKAVELTEGLDPDNAQFASKYQEVFQKLPNTLQEIGDYLVECEAMLRCMQNSYSAKLVKDYEDKKFLLGQLGKSIECVRTKKSELEQQCLKLKNKWFPQINRLVAIINEKFSRSFCFLGCAGGVTLDQGEQPEEVENYGINIKVKFRNDSDLLVLNSYTQSGGEKTLSIAIYLLSLQSVINVPFRWVDEINQGMDEFNEVRVYFLMMCEISNDPTAQYFVITPKLTPGIKMSAETSVHFIFSGEIERTNDDSDYKHAKNRKLSHSNTLKWSQRKYFEHLGITKD